MAKLKSSNNPLGEINTELKKNYQRPSHELIYESMMRGGAAFGPPFEVSTATLTQRIVRLFKQVGFFGFETFDRIKTGRRKNKFTRYGAARYKGPLLKVDSDDKSKR